MSDELSKAKVMMVLAMGLVAIGFSPILVRFAPGTPPLVLAAFRTSFAAVLLIPYWLIKREKSSADLKERLLVAIAGICLGLHFICWISSLYYTSVASASVLVGVHPIILILVERLWHKRVFAFTTWVGVIMAFGGSVLLGISDSQIKQHFANPLLGNGLALTAAMIFVVYLLIGQKIRQKRAWVDYVFPVYSFSAVICIIIALIFGNDLLDISTTGIAVGFGLALGPQILGHGSMNYAVKNISPTFLSTLILVEPLQSALLAFLIFDELPPITSIAAMVIILCGVGLTWKRKTVGK